MRNRLEVFLRWLYLFGNQPLQDKKKKQIERVQRCAFYIILGKEYKGYEEALKILELESLEERRLTICEKFAKKAVKHPKYKNWFNLNQQTPTIHTRFQNINKFIPVKTRTERYRNSPLPYLTNILNRLNI